MSFTAFTVFTPYTGAIWTGSSSSNQGGGVSDPYNNAQDGSYFELNDWSFDIEQKLNIGSQATGAGAGKVTFNPFSITRQRDAKSPLLFAMACSGTPFKFVDLLIADTSGDIPSLASSFRFGLVALKTVAWVDPRENDDDEQTEIITFEYGSLIVAFGATKSGARGWDRVRNVAITP